MSLSSSFTNEVPAAGPILLHHVIRTWSSLIHRSNIRTIIRRLRPVEYRAFDSLYANYSSNALTTSITYLSLSKNLVIKTALLLTAYLYYLSRLKLLSHWDLSTVIALAVCIVFQLLELI
jgi:hypothetical protein